MLVWVEIEAEPSRRLRELVELLAVKLDSFLVERFRCGLGDCRAVVTVEGSNRADLWLLIPYTSASYKLELRKGNLEVSGCVNAVFSLEGDLEQTIEDAIRYMVPCESPVDVYEDRGKGDYTPEPVEVEGW